MAIIMRLLFALLASVSLYAHDLYLMASPFIVSPGGKVRIAMHNGDNFPLSDAAPRIERIVEPRILTAAGASPIENLRVEEKSLIGDVTVSQKGNVIATVSTKPNPIKLAPSTFETYLKHEGLQHVIEWRAKHGESSTPGRERYSKYIKAILLSGQPSNFYNHVAGHIIEMIPETNPYLAKPGDTIPVRVQFRGKPASGLQIEMSWLTPDGKPHTEIAGRTGSDGRILIPFKARGIWKLHTVLMERCEDSAAADWESFWTSLTFELQ